MDYRGLKEHDAGSKKVDLARKRGISEATLNNGKVKFGGMDVSEAKRLRAWEQENVRLKKLLAEQKLDRAAKRAAVAHPQAVMSLSERRPARSRARIEA